MFSTFGTFSRTASSQILPIPRTYFSNPTTIAGCQMWMDATDLSSVVLSSPSVSQWNDKSGFNRHATQQTASSPTTYNSTGFNGFPAIQFSATGMLSSMIHGTLTLGTSVFVVFQKNGAKNPYEGLVSRTIDMYVTSRFIGKGVPNAQRPADYDDYPSSFDLGAATDLNIFAMQVNRASYQEHINGICSCGVKTLPYEDAADSFYIGTRADKNTKYTGVIAGVIVYDSVLSDSSRETRVEIQYEQKISINTPILQHETSTNKVDS